MIGILTETTLSINAADITWTPTVTSVIIERNIDTSGMSTLDRAIFAQECDELPSAAAPQCETDSDATTDDDVELRGDEAKEEKLEDAEDAVERDFKSKTGDSECEEVREVEPMR